MKKGLKRGLIFFAIIALMGLLLVISLMVIAHPYNGKWKMDAYGFCLEIKEGFVRNYEVTDHYYTRVKQYDGVIINDTLYCGLGKFKLEKRGKQLNLLDEGSQVVYQTNHQANSYFKDLKKVKDTDSISRFNMFYEILKENYAFAGLYGVDFDAEYERYAPLVKKDTSEDMLYQYMCNMVEGLNDGHVYVNWKDKEYEPSNYKPDWAADKEQIDNIGYVVKNIYVKDYYKFKDCYIRYGTLREDIGYINITGMGMKDKTATSKKAMYKIMEQLQNMNTLVIDLRFCDGGYDGTSLMIAGYFTQDSYLAYQKQAYYKGKYTTLQDIYVKPGKSNYKGNVVVLTSGYTVSAGETLLQALLANPDQKIELVGEESAGYYSDSIPKLLPGGYCFGMSTERYIGSDDLMLEGKGIIPDIVIPINANNTEQGKDKALDYVLEKY